MTSAARGAALLLGAPPLALLAPRAARAAASAAGPGPRNAHSQAPAVGAVYAVGRTFDAAAVEAFTSLTGDANPIHVCRERAGGGAPPAPDRSGAVVPGMLLASLFPAIIGTHFHGALYLTQTLAFRSPCAVGERVRAEVTVTRASGGRVAFDTVCRAEADGRTLVDGAALALLTRRRPGSDGDNGSAPAPKEVRITQKLRMQERTSAGWSLRVLPRVRET
jgi:3-hydroxybutyryl-CoA dehydratase